MNTESDTKSISKADSWITKAWNGEYFDSIILKLCSFMIRNGIIYKFESVYFVVFIIRFNLFYFSVLLSISILFFSTYDLNFFLLNYKNMFLD